MCHHEVIYPSEKKKWCHLCRQHSFLLTLACFFNKKSVSKLWYLFEIIPHIDFVQMQSSTLLIKRVFSLCQRKVITLEA